jgi:hypothetical protein
MLIAVSAISVYAGVPGQDRVAEAKRLLALEAKGDYAAVESNVAPNSKRTLSEITLRTRWTGIVKRAGPLQSIGAGKLQKIAQYDMVIVPCKFAKGDVETKITFNSDGQVVSFFFNVPGNSKVPAEARGPGGPPRGAGGPPRGPGGPPPK